MASESSLNTGSEALKLQIKQLEEQLLEQSKRQQVAVEGQKVELDARFEKINAALLAQVTADQEAQVKIDAQIKGLTAEVAALKGSLDQQAVDVAALKKQGNPGAAIERLEQDLMVLKSELENRPVPAKGANAAEFDVFRAQVTRNINTLQSQIQNLQKQISARP